MSQKTKKSNTLPVQGCIHCCPERTCEYHKASNNPEDFAMTQPPIPDRSTRIREIRERCEKATKGPWTADDFCEEADICARVGTTDGSEHYYQESSTIAICAYDDDEPPEKRKIGPVGAERNAAFIAHAREDIPWLLDQLAAIDGEVREQCEKKLDGMRRIHLVCRSHNQLACVVGDEDRQRTVTFSTPRDAEKAWDLIVAAGRSEE